MKLPKLNLSTQEKYVVFSTVFLIFAAFLLTWFLQYRYFINNIDATWAFVWERPKVFWFSTALMFLMLVFLTGLTRRPFVAAGTMWAFLIVLTYIHINKFNSRGFPLLPEDFALASESASLAKFVNVGQLVGTIISVILVLFLTFLGNYWVRKKYNLARHKQEKRWWRRWAAPTRVVMVVVSAIVFMNLTDFVRHHHGQRYEDIGWLNSQLVAWNQVRNYDYNGFILGFLYNLQKAEVTPPDGYNEEKMAGIAKKYAKLTKTENKEKSSIDDEDVNLIIILNESFFDPAVEYAGYSFETYYPHVGGEILPNWRRIKSQYPSGYMYSTDYGGGTANIEFEVLTGLTNYWLNTVPYTNLVPRAGDIPSIASYAKSKDYKTTAIHPFNGSMYKRNIALTNFGFDTFITESEMKYTEKEGKSEYINDRSAYKQTLDVLNESDENQLITLITMQNHLPYNADTYDTKQFTVINQNIEEGRASDISVYYQMLHNSDQYLGEFLNELDNSEKKVAVLFFGDHSAGIFDLTNGAEEKEVRDLSRLTPYFIYTNFETENSESALATTTPNCLGNALFNHLGVKKPEIYYLLDTVCEEAPILANAWFDNDGPFKSTALSEYELITYDLLVGKKYWQK